MKKRIVVRLPIVKQKEEITKEEYDKIQTQIDAFIEEKKKPVYTSPKIQALFDKEIVRLNKLQLRKNGHQHYIPPTKLKLHKTTDETYWFN